MYGKVFSSMYDGTLCANWKALITFQQMIILADDAGTVDMTPHALSARTGIPLKYIEEGIEVLESDDPYSRSPEQNGRRLERLDRHRPWGWTIINYLKYRNLADHDEKKKKDRERIAAKRKGENPNEINDVAKCRKVSRDVADVADVAYIDTDTDIDIKDTTRENAVSTTAVPNQKIIDKWNALAARLGLPQTIKTTTALKGQIRQRWKDMPTLDRWDNFFEYVASNDFLAGRSQPGAGRDKPFRSTLLWITKEGNFAKIAAKEYE